MNDGYVSIQIFIFITLLIAPLLMVILTCWSKNRNALRSDFWNNQRWDCKDIIIVMIIITVGRTLCYSLPRINNANPVLTSIVVLFIFIIFYGIFPICYLHFKGLIDGVTLGLTRSKLRGGTKLGIKYFIYFGSLPTIALVLVYKYNKTIDPPISGINSYFLDQPIYWTLLFVFTTIIAGPLIEEVLFRGVLYGPILRRLDRQDAMSMTAAVWTLMHFSSIGAADIISFIWMFIIGIILCRLYDKSESIIPCMVMHSLLNGTRIVMPFILRLLG